MNFFDTIMFFFTNLIWIHICRFVAINIASLFFNLHMFFHQSRCIDYRVSERFQTCMRQQFKPLEEIVVGNDNHRAP
ncbi:hypothetical protein LINPERHAP1_LOCUS21720, partial [Linum perenne]